MPELREWNLLTVRLATNLTTGAVLSTKECRVYAAKRGARPLSLAAHSSCQDTPQSGRRRRR